MGLWRKRPGRFGFSDDRLIFAGLPCRAGKSRKPGTVADCDEQRLCIDIELGCDRCGRWAAGRYRRLAIYDYATKNFQRLLPA
jgi:hypothetical protein